MESSQLVLPRTSNPNPVQTPTTPLESYKGLRDEVSVAQIAGAADKLVLDKTLAKVEDATVVKVGKFDSQFVLSVSAEEIVAKLNSLLADDLPGGIESLDPQEFTPEATAQRITDQIAGLFPAFREQNPELSDEEAVEEFMRLASKGVQQGYEEAFEILDGLGALQVDGVKETIEKTLSAIKEKLSELETKLRESLGLPIDYEQPEESSETVSQSTPATESTPTDTSLLAKEVAEPTGEPPGPLLEPLQQL